MTSVEAQARNRLLFLLLFAAGSVDALSYLFLRVFPANMTGNTVLLGIALVEHDVVHLRGSAIAPSRSLAWHASGVPELIGLAAVAMGLQSAAILRLDLEEIGGTFITGTLTRLVARTVTAARRDLAVPDGNHGGSLLAVVWLPYLAGARSPSRRSLLS